MQHRGAVGSLLRQPARRDLAQRIRTTDAVNQLSAEAIARAETDRDRTLIGLHGPFFYDA